MAFASELNGFATTHKGHLALGDVVTAYAAEVARWQELTGKLGGMGMSGDQRYPVLSATPYLELTGNLVVAWMLLTQAVVAHDKLQGLFLDQGIMDPAARATLCREHPEAVFYSGKIDGARFFVHHVLVRNRALVAEIDSGDRTPLTWVV